MKTQNLQRRELELLKEQKKLYENLPHLHGWPWYKWAREFFDSDNRMNFICAGNQISKSSTQIRKAIHWATEPSIWPHLWRTRPTTFWYLYPSKELAHVEVMKKWIPEFLPREELKEHEQYGWRVERRDRWVWAIHFNTGVTIYFKTYAQDTQHLQAGTSWSVFCFTKGHEVLTRSGLKRIEDIREGEYVKTRGGYQRVKLASSRVDDVYRVKFSNGQYLEGTSEHPVMTQAGWKQLGQLTEKDSAYTYPLWKLQRNWFCLKAFCIGVIQTTQISARKIILEGHSPAISYMSKYGKRTTSVSAKQGLSYTTKTLTHQTIGSRIFNFLQERSTRVSTSLPSGKKRSTEVSFAIGAIRSFCLGLLRKIAAVTVHSSVESMPTATGRKRVYNLTVENEPEYFCNGILVHNCDEEIPYDIFPEINRRISATRGYFHMVFTATLGQLEWKDTVEGRGRREKFPNAAKWQVSMYDCQKYMDGTPSPWTPDRIKEEEALIGDAKEVERRINGKFVVSGGLKYGGFNRDFNVKLPMALEMYKGWHIYSGVDIGSGLSPDGNKGHPSAICFVAVRPDYKYGRVFRGWIGKDVQTTAGDVINKYVDISKDIVLTQHFYDWHNKDFHIIAQRAGIPFEPAEKGHEIGETKLNTLFKNGMMDIDDIPELEHLTRELGALLKDTAKTKAKDDFSDALRYAVTRIPWDFSAIRDNMLGANKVRKPKYWVESNDQRLLRERLEFKKVIQSVGTPIQEVWEEEIAACNELYEV